jgi:hypothetical protein
MGGGYSPDIKTIIERMLIREQLKIFSKKMHELLNSNPCNCILFNYCLPNKSNSLATTSVINRLHHPYHHSYDALTCLR